VVTRERQNALNSPAIAKGARQRGHARFPSARAINSQLKGAIEAGQYADAWLHLGDKGMFDDKPLKLKMDFSQNDGAMHFDLDAATLAPRGMAALCPTAAPPKTGGRCSIFSLKGFARAYDFVCEAKQVCAPPLTPLAHPELVER
jgi:hypothetical protein